MTSRENGALKIKARSSRIVDPFFGQVQKAANVIFVNKAARKDVTFPFWLLPWLNAALLLAGNARLGNKKDSL